MLTVVVDTGYSGGSAAAACEADGIVARIPTNRGVNNQGNGEHFSRSEFRFDADHNQYACPAGNFLTYKSATKKGMQLIYEAQARRRLWRHGRQGV